MVRVHLSRLLGEQKWSQAELSRRTGIRASTVNEWYHEIMERLTVEHIDKVCEALNCSISDLLEYIPNKQQKTGENLIIEEHGNRKDRHST